MKTFRSSFLRPWGSLVHGLGVVGVMVSGWFGFLWMIVHTSSGRGSRRLAAEGLLRDPGFLVPAALIAVIGLWVVLHKFGSNRGRYHAGAREIEIRNGLVWQTVRYLRYSDIKSIDLHEGPLMRLVGSSDLEIFASEAPHRVILHGVPKGEEVRRFLLERRDSLRELSAGEKS